MLEANNTIFDYDIISLCETSLTNETVDKVPVIEGYTFLSANHPSNIARGGVGIFYKNSLPLIVRPDLSFDESLVVEVKLQRKKIFFTVLYRSLSAKSNSVEFQTFLRNFRNLKTSQSKCRKSLCNVFYWRLQWPFSSMVFCWGLCT